MLQRSPRVRCLRIVSLIALVAAGCEPWPLRGSRREAPEAAPAPERAWPGRGWREPAYPLDTHSRSVPEEGPLECPDIELVRYRGGEISYGRGVRVAPPFQEKLERFERIAAEVGEEIMRRPPESVRHFGAFNCRRVRGRPYRMSEHGLGNGIDVSGFRFGPAPREAREDLPRRLWWRTTVSVLDHWDAAEDETKDESDVLKSRFLRELTRRLAEEDVFRGMLGPAHPRHRNHFHFDHGPRRYRIL